MSTESQETPANQLPPNVVAFIRESFNILDSEGKGEVGKPDVRSMLITLGISDPDDSKLNKMMTQDAIRFQEYFKLMGDFLAEFPSKQDLRFMFQQYTNKSKLLDPELKSELLKQGLTQEEIDSVYKKFVKLGPEGEQFDIEKFVNTMSV